MIFIPFLLAQAVPAAPPGRLPLSPELPAGDLLQAGLAQEQPAGDHRHHLPHTSHLEPCWNWAAEKGKNRCGSSGKNAELVNQMYFEGFLKHNFSAYSLTYSNILKHTQTLNMSRRLYRCNPEKNPRVLRTHSHSETTSGVDYWNDDYYTPTYDPNKDCTFEAEMVNLLHMPGVSRCSSITTVSMMV